MSRLMLGDLSLNVVVHGNGKGSALIVLHGFTGSVETWSPFLADWGRRRTVVAIDLLGHGDSDAPDDPERYRVEYAVADILAVADRLGFHAFDLLGYSLGGRVALHLTLAALERVRSLILESVSPGILDPAERQARIASDEDLAKVLEEEGILAFVDRWERMPLFASQATLPADVRARLRAQRLRGNPRGLANSLRGIGAGRMPALQPSLDQIKRPMLAIVGALDTKYLGVGRDLVARVPSARLVIVPEAGHAVHLERPDLFNRLVVDFLDRKEK